MMEGIFYFSDNKEVYGYIIVNNVIKYPIDTIAGTVTTSDGNITLDGDTVLFDEDRHRIIKIIKRSNQPILGTLCTSSRVTMGITKRGVPQKKFIPINKKYPHFIVATRRKVQSTDMYAQIRLSEYDISKSKYPIGNLDRLIGNVGDYDTELEFLKCKYGIKWKKYRDNEYKDYENEDVISDDRYDFVDYYTISIDPEGCKDIDDALHCRDIDDKHVEIGVHIADVSSYIEKGSELDKIIASKGESVYLKNEQINMLPDILATNICSLLEGKRKRTFTTLFTVEKDTGKIVKTEFKKGYIVNDKALKYEEAEKLINQDSTVTELYNIGQKIYDNKLTNTDFINCNDTYDTHKMIEVYMVMTNVAVATFLADKIPEHSIFRVHEQNTGAFLKGNPENSDIVRIANIMRLDRAEYVVGKGSNIGHQTLGKQYYTHFTSPIRRYVDILVHRLLFKVLNSDNIHDTHISYDNTDVIKNINRYHTNIKNASRESYILDTIYDIYYDENSVFDTYGYITGINNNVISIHIPELKIDTMFKIFSDKIKRIISYTTTPDEITVDDKTYKILDRIDIKVVIAIKKPDIKKKVLIQIN
jgi:exosome complex exonuclease DIS3/RRP44